MKGSAFKPIWFIGVVVLLLGLFMASRDALAPDELIPWRTDLSSARAESREANKPVLIDFTATWCEPCQAMKRTTFADPSVANALQKFIPVRIDVDKDPETARRFGLETLPYFVVIPPGEDVPSKAISIEFSADAFKEWLGS